MKTSKLLRTLAFPLALAVAGCATVRQGPVQRISGPGLREKWLGESLEATRNFIQKHGMRDVYKIYTKKGDGKRGQQIAIYAEGRLYGNHFGEVTSFPALFDGSTEDGVANLDGSEYLVEKE